MGDQAKTCPRCAASKPLTAFRRNVARPDGLSFYCRDCFKEIDKARYRSRREADGFKVRPRESPPDGCKWCPDCQAYRPTHEFSLNRASRDGLNSYCRQHHNERSRDSYLARSYGLTTNKVRVLVDRQGGVCLICLRGLGSNPHVDHDHETGQLRGLLCFNCNGGLGQFKDSTFALERAKQYLEGTLVAPVKVGPGMYELTAIGWRPGS